MSLPRTLAPAGLLLSPGAHTHSMTRASCREMSMLGYAAATYSPRVLLSRSSHLRANAPNSSPSSQSAISHYDYTTEVPLKKSVDVGDTYNSVHDFVPTMFMEKGNAPCKHRNVPMSFYCITQSESPASSNSSNIGLETATCS